ncbi:unnamed protein product [marine sediment metagenome]|uniref:PAS domain-containing protein n=1 Tax=marine sediment metagenome TaxID=412755 RepID=X1AB96_9ZZZZ
MKNKSTSTKTDWMNTPAFKDLLLIGLIAILAFVLAEALELAETIDKVALRYETWPIYDFITMPAIISFAFGLYSLRRWKELRLEITEHKEAECKLRLAEERYRTIFENSAVAITMADEQERLISWNKFTEDLLKIQNIINQSGKSIYVSYCDI